MYFQAFHTDIRPELSTDVLFTVEELISQILVTADLGFLHAAFQEQRLAHVLCEELGLLRPGAEGQPASSAGLPPWTRTSAP